MAFHKLVLLQRLSCDIKREYLEGGRTIQWIKRNYQRLSRTIMKCWNRYMFLIFLAYFPQGFLLFAFHLCALELFSINFFFFFPIIQYYTPAGEGKPIIPVVSGCTTSAPTKPRHVVAVTYYKDCSLQTIDTDFHGGIISLQYTQTSPDSLCQRGRL